MNASNPSQPLVAAAALLALLIVDIAPVEAAPTAASPMPAVSRSLIERVQYSYPPYYAYPRPYYPYRRFGYGPRYGRFFGPGARKARQNNRRVRCDKNPLRC